MTAALLLAAGAFGDVLPSIAGVLLVLIGAALAFMGLMAVADGAVRRGLGGVMVGLAFAAGGCWLIGVW